MQHTVTNFTSWLRCMIYPHAYWASEITRALRDHAVRRETTIIDAPCGEGIISYWVARAFPGQNLELIDRDERALSLARSLVPSARVVNSDLNHLEHRTGDDIWLLINSLFLLSDPAEVLARMHDRAALIIGIFPYPEHPNYRCFNKKNPDLQNPSEMTQEETVTFFRHSNYRNVACTPLTPIPYHCMRVPMLNGLLRRFFLLLDPFLESRNGAYWLGVFERT